MRSVSLVLVLIAGLSALPGLRAEPDGTPVSVFHPLPTVRLDPPRVDARLTRVQGPGKADDKGSTPPRKSDGKSDTPPAKTDPPRTPTTPRPPTPPASPPGSASAPATPPAPTGAGTAQAQPPADPNPQVPAFGQSQLQGPGPIIGNLPGYAGVRPIVVRTTLSRAAIPPSVLASSLAAVPNFAQTTDSFAVLAPILTRGAFKIAENEFVLPQDRIYLSYHYFRNVPVRVLSQDSALTVLPGALGLDGTSPDLRPLRTTFTGSLFGDPTQPRTSLTDTRISPAGVHREVLGAEKTFLGGAASIGVRVPFFHLNQSVTSTPNGDRLDAFQGPGVTTAQVTGISNGLDQSAIGDLSFILKLALLTNPRRGEALCVGLMATTPTGEPLRVGGTINPTPEPIARLERPFFPFLVPGPGALVDPQIVATPPAGTPVPTPSTTIVRSFLFQPYASFLVSVDGFYLHGFSSVVLGTDEHDPKLWFNDVGVGYVLDVGSADAILQALIPTLEAHQTTNLAPGKSGLLQLERSLAFTAGLHVRLAGGSLITLGYSQPLTRSRPYDSEFAILYNWRF